MLPLVEALLEQKYVFVGFSGDQEKGEAEKHLLDLGFTKGTDLRVVSKSGDNVVVMVHDSRIAIDASMAQRIIVSEVVVEPVMDTMKLSELGIGNYSKIVGIMGKGAVKRRLMDMGLTKGIDVFVRKVAPLGDPMEINVRGYELTLRKAEAELVIVEEPVRGEK